MNKSNTEEIIAILWFILAAVIVGIQGWGVFSVIAVSLGGFSILCSIYRGVEQLAKEGNK